MVAVPQSGPSVVLIVILQGYFPLFAFRNIKHALPALQLPFLVEDPLAHSKTHFRSPTAVMSSYSYLNGSPFGENALPFLLDGFAVFRGR